MRSVSRHYLAALKSTLAIIRRHPLLIVGFVYLITLLVLPKDYFWIADNDNKYLQVEAISASGYNDYSIPWPGQVIDPDMHYNPLPAPFSQVSGDRLYSIFSPVFSTLSTIPYRLFGFRGLYLLPLAGGIFALVGLVRIGKTVGLDERIITGATLIAGLATPLWFYSVLFWEHTIAAALCVWAVLFLIRYAEVPTFSNLSMMSVFAALAVYFRDELYLFCAVLVAVSAWQTPEAKHRGYAVLHAAAVMAGILAPLWLFQWWAIGHPFGFHLGMHLFSASGIMAHIAVRPRVMYNLIFAIHPNKLLSVLITAPWIVLLVLPSRYLGNRIRLTAVSAAGGGLILSVVMIAGYAVSPGPIVWLLTTNSLLTAAPVLVLAVIPNRSQKTHVLEHVRTVTALYLMVYVLAAPEMGSTGIHWGNRFMLILYPFIGLLAAVGIGELLRNTGRWRRSAIAVVMLLITLSFAAQVYSITLIGAKKDFNRRLTAAVVLRPERVLVTDVWWAPQALSRVFYERQIFYAPGQEALQELGKKLVESGTTAVLYVTAAGERAAPGGAVRIGDGGLGFFTLDLIPLTLRTGETR